MINTNIYDCPISEEIGHLKMMMADEHDRMVLKAVQQVSIEIDQESLIQAINSDRKRYEEAYKRGYTDCEEHYKKLLSQINKLTSFEEDSTQTDAKNNTLDMC